jgi:ABC-2 type transport system permease protein
MLAMFRKEVRVVLRDRTAFVFSLFVPILVITVIASALFHSDGGPNLIVPVVNDDEGPVASTFIKLMREHADVREVTRAEAEYLVRDANRAPAAMIFPQGMSKRYLQGRSSDIQLLTDPAAGTDLQAVKMMLLLVDKKAASLADPFSEELITLSEKNLTGNRLSVTSFEQNVPGFSIMFVLMAVIFGTSAGMHDEREQGTLERLLVAPGGFTRILMGKLGARFVLGIGQAIVLFAWGHWMFNVSLGSSAAAFLALVSALVFAVVAVGMLAAGLARTREQTIPLGLSFVMVFSGLGGLWWPQSVQPQWMSRISDVVFTSWAMRGMNDLVLRDRGMAAIALPAVVLVAQGALLLAAGLKLFRVRHSAR